MAARIPANPDVLPCRRDHQRFDALEGLVIVDRCPMRVDLRKASTTANPAKTRPVDDAPLAYQARACKYFWRARPYLVALNFHPLQDSSRMKTRPSSDLLPIEILVDHTKHQTE
jgi:hypothetical protein